MFVTILTSDDKCFLLNRDNLRQPIQMQLSEKQKIFSEFCAAILKSRLDFEHFQTNGDHQSWGISKITDSKERSQINV